MTLSRLLLHQSSCCFQDHSRPEEEVSTGHACWKNVQLTLSAEEILDRSL